MIRYRYASGDIRVSNEIDLIDNIPNTIIGSSTIHGEGLFSAVPINHSKNPNLELDYNPLRMVVSSDTWKRSYAWMP